MVVPGHPEGGSRARPDCDLFGSEGSRKDKAAGEFGVKTRVMIPFERPSFFLSLCDASSESTASRSLDAGGRKRTASSRESSPAPRSVRIRIGSPDEAVSNCVL
jgi:hypothetical protein